MVIKSSQSQDAILDTVEDDKPVFLGKISARYVLTALLCLGNGVMYTHRTGLTIAIVTMVNRTTNYVSEDNETSYFESSCPFPQEKHDKETSSDVNEGSFNWNPYLEGVILGGFYYGYVLTQTAGGWMSERFPPKLVFLAGTVISSLLTLLVPIVAEYSFALLVALRVTTGAAQGLTLPTSYSFISRWVPSQERSFHISIALTGGLLLNIATLPLAGYLCKEGFAGGWPSVFYVFGTAGLIFSIPFYFLVYNKPSDHPRISKDELAYIKQGVPKNQPKKPKVPWSSALTSYRIWTLTLSRITTAFMFHIVSNKIPTYLDVILHYPIDQNGLLNSLLYIVQAFTQILSGYLSDVVRRRQWLSTNSTRKLFQAFAAVGGSACLLSVPFAGCQGLAVIVLLVGTMGILGFISGGELPVIADMAPAFSGSLFGLTNSIVGITGFLAPLVAGAFLDGHENSIVHWSYVMYLAAGMGFAGALVFVFFTEAKLQPWAEIKDSEDPENNKSKQETTDKERY